MYRQIVNLLVVLAIAVLPLQANSETAPSCGQGTAHSAGANHQPQNSDDLWQDCCEQFRHHDITRCNCKIVHTTVAPVYSAHDIRVPLTTSYDSVPSSIITTRAVCPLLRPPQTVA